ncbi:hypothetical protein DFH07DRAFT_59460 [Mycena maculata]|uniref:Uncharacterized protein n=1 Tax=Mycena maculata TaxID=230809 RepID=A0AAD7N192_9AGAR|nr:hypothetical protein DFH07DRAFT_59460 [Mycena maculata]
MSSQDAELFAIRDIYLNITFLQVFVHGIYSAIFFLALYAMIFKRKTPAAFFVIVLTMYTIATIQTGLHWASIRDAFVRHGSSPTDTVNSLGSPTLALTVLSGTMLIGNTLLADCVLIFRCFAVWNRDWRAIVLPVLTTLSATALGILSVFETAQVVELGGNLSSDPPKFVDYARPYFCLCLATTLLATILIVFRIVWITRYNAGTAFSGYRAVIEMVVESALLYSASLIVYIGILFGSAASNDDGYAQAILIEMTGIAPTLIVARVSFGLARPSSSWQRTTKTAPSSNFAASTTATTLQFSKNLDLESNPAMEKEPST